jgi:hypothetical protein
MAMFIGQEVLDKIFSKDGYYRPFSLSYGWLELSWIGRR